MDTTTFMKWFDEIFPYIRGRTRSPVLLFIKNTTDHIIQFKCENVKVKLFPPNITSWKQPMYMVIIDAVKKIYKYLLIKETIGFQYLTSEL